MQDSSLSAVGKIVDRMAELRTMAQDITKNTGDIENYSKEFIELQSQLNQISKEKFNGISLFSNGAGTASTVLNKSSNGGTYINTDGASLSYTTFSRTLQTHDSGASASGSVSINVINFDFMLSIGGLAGVSGTSNFSLGGISLGTGGSSKVTGGFINDIKAVSVGQFIDIISRVAICVRRMVLSKIVSCKELTCCNPI